MSNDTRQMVQWNGDRTAQSTVRAKRTVQLWNGSGSSIAAGAVVALDRAVTTYGSGMSIKTAVVTSEVEDLAGIGGAVRLIPNLSWGEVQVEGIQESVAVADAVAAGELLTCDTTTGRLTKKAADPAVQVSDLARALTDGDGSNLGTVEWMNPFKY